MYFKILIFSLLFMLSNGSLFAQKKEKKAIDQVIKNYFEGYLEGNIKKLAMAFDTTSGAMIASVKDTATIQYKFNSLLKRWVENAQKKPFSEQEIKNSFYKIKKLELINENLAITTIEIKLGKNLFVDVLSLYKVNEKWKIVSKVFIKK